MEMKNLKGLIGKSDNGERKTVGLDSFKRLQEKVRGHGEILTKLKAAER